MNAVNGAQRQKDDYLYGRPFDLPLTAERANRVGYSAEG